jgi:hypothetical protein
MPNRQSAGSERGAVLIWRSFARALPCEVRSSWVEQNGVQYTTLGFRSDSRGVESVAMEVTRVAFEMLTELHDGGATICLVSHDPRWTEVARRTVDLFDGAIVARE